MARQQAQAETARVKREAEAEIAAVESRANAKIELLEEQLRGKVRAEGEAEVRLLVCSKSKAFNTWCRVL